MRFTSGPLQVTIKYTYTRGDTTYYQRFVPTDLRHHYPNPKIRHDLKTSDPLKVAQMVVKLNRQYEAEWASLKAAPESSPEALKVAARSYLAKWGLEPHSPKNDENAIRLLHDHIDSKRMAFADGDDEQYHDAGSSDYLSPVEVEAGRLLHGTSKPTIRDIQKVYLETHKKRDKDAFITYTTRSFNGLIAVTGDKEVEAFTRDDARRYLNEALQGGNRTATVRRRLNVFVAAWGAYKREKAPYMPNPFERQQIANEGEDRAQRTPFTPEQLAALYAACREKDDDRRWLFALMIDTGARIAEVAGLALGDLKVSAEIPHVVIQPHPWRTLKNRNSARQVPLVGASLWAARRIIETARDDQAFAFPRYTNATRCANATASATLVKWVRSLKSDGLNHELRHTMSDRLREVQCPKPIMGAIEGHGKQDVGDRYGHGYSLTVKREWLDKVALKVTSGVSHAGGESEGDPEGQLQIGTDGR